MSTNRFRIVVVRDKLVGERFTDKPDVQLIGQVVFTQSWDEEAIRSHPIFSDVEARERVLESTLMNIVSALKSGKLHKLLSNEEELEKEANKQGPIA